MSFCKRPTCGPVNCTSRCQLCFQEHILEIDVKSGCWRDYFLKGNMNVRNVSGTADSCVCDQNWRFYSSAPAAGLMTSSLQGSCATQLHWWCNILNAALNPITVLFKNLSITLVMEKCKKLWSSRAKIYLNLSLSLSLVLNLSLPACLSLHLFLLPHIFSSLFFLCSLILFI